jgi:membrane protein YqaA with SNARE-associated domain
MPFCLGIFISFNSEVIIAVYLLENSRMLCYLLSTAILSAFTEGIINSRIQIKLPRSQSQRLTFLQPTLALGSQR